jgi:hypothetical protein
VSTTDAVLAAIDGALEDYETSKDAMRWSPDPGPLRFVAPRPYRVDLEQFAEQFAEAAARWAVQMRTAVAAYNGRVAPVLSQIRKAFEALNGELSPPRRVDLAGERRVATMMRQRARRTAKRGRRPAPAGR